METKLTRRGFLTRTMGSGAAFYLLPHGLALSALAEADQDGAPVSAPFPSLGFFSDDERAALGSMCDEIFPNAASLGAVHYIETLLTAFDSDPPKIYAGGPYSGRNPFSKNGAATDQFPENSFAQFEPLNRVQTAAWKLQLYGSSAFAGGYWNEKVTGPVTGLRDFFKAEIKNAIASNGGEQSPPLSTTTREFSAALKPLVLEACFGAPEYGGNQETAGWRSVYFQGDSQPLGYSMFDDSTQAYVERADFPVSTFDANDPKKMGFLTRAFCFVIALFRGGRIY